jgi:hypothetical protein
MKRSALRRLDRRPSVSSSWLVALKAERTFLRYFHTAMKWRSPREGKQGVISESDGGRTLVRDLIQIRSAFSRHWGTSSRICWTIRARRKRSHRSKPGRTLCSSECGRWGAARQAEKVGVSTGLAGGPATDGPTAATGLDTSSAIVQLNGDPLSTYVKTKPPQGRSTS